MSADTSSPPSQLELSSLRPPPAHTRSTSQQSRDVSDLENQYHSHTHSPEYDEITLVDSVGGSDQQSSTSRGSKLRRRRDYCYVVLAGLAVPAAIGMGVGIAQAVSNRPYEPPSDGHPRSTRPTMSSATSTSWGPTTTVPGPSSASITGAGDLQTGISWSPAGTLESETGSASDLFVIPTEVTVARGIDKKH